jgi:hypothetical protein
MVCHVERKTQANGVREKGVEQDIWAEKDKVTGEWRRLRNEELHDPYFSPSLVRVLK